MIKDDLLAYSLWRLSFITGRASQNVSTCDFFGLWRQQQLVANWKAKVVTADEHAKFVNDPWSGPCNLLHLLNSAQRKFNGPHIQLTNARLPKMKLLQLWGICCQVARGCRLHIFPDCPSIPVYILPLVFFLQRRGHAPCRSLHRHGGAANLLLRISLAFLLLICLRQGLDPTPSSPSMQGPRCPSAHQTMQLPRYPWAPPHHPPPLPPPPAQGQQALHFKT